MKNYLIFFLIALPLKLQAGNETHGGDLVVCDGKDPIVLDYFHAAIKKYGEEKNKIVDITHLTQDEVVSLFKERLKPFPVFFSQFESALARVGKLEDWLEADLKEVDDSDEPYFLPKGCERKQGAVRQSNTLYVDPTYVKKLSPAQEGVLVIHETLYWIATELGKLNNSVSVRELARSILRDDASSIHRIQAITLIGGNAFAFEWLHGKTYRPSAGSGPNIKFVVDSIEKGLVYATLFNSSGIELTVTRAELQCKNNRCKVIKPTTYRGGSILSLKDETFEIEEEGRLIRWERIPDEPYFKG